MRLEFLLLSLLLFTKAGFAEPLQFDHFDCHSTSPSTADCKIFLKGDVVANDMLYLKNVYDIDRMQFQGQEIGRTGFRYQSKYYARFLPRTYSLKNITGAHDPILDLKAESILAPGAGLFGDSVIKVVPEHKEWALQAKSLWLPALYTLLCLMAFFFGISYCATSTPDDGWLWRYTELRVFYFSCVIALFYNSEIPKLIVPSIIAPEQYLQIQSFAWIVVIWSLSQLICESVFSDPSAVERIRSRSTWLDRILTYAAGSFLVGSIVLTSLHSYLALPVQLFGLGAITAARIWQTRFSRVLRRSTLSGIHSYCLMIGFSLLLLASACFKSQWIFAAFSPVTAVCSLLLLALMIRHRSLLALKQECAEFVQTCREQLLLKTKGGERVQILAESVQEYWEGARVSLVSLRGEMGLLLASAGPMGLTVHANLDARRVGPLVRRVCREKHLLYAPISEELGCDLSKEGLKYSTVAIPVIESNEVRVVLLFMAHEGERIAPRDALAMQWVGNAMGLEMACAAQQMMTEQNLEQMRFRIAHKHGLVLEDLDPWDRIAISQSQQMRRIFICLSSPKFKNKQMEQLIFTHSMLKNVYQDFSRELQKLWLNARKQFEFLVHEESGRLYFVAPKTFKRPDLEQLGPELAAHLLLQQLYRQSMQLAQEERFRVLHLDPLPMGLYAGHLDGFEVQNFYQRMLDKDCASPLIHLDDEKLLEASTKTQVKMRRVA